MESALVPDRNPRSTNSQRRRIALSRDAIADNALEIADREGLEGLTIRKVASRLGVSPMAVYRHFQDKAEILLSLVDHVLSGAQIEAPTELPPKAWLLQTFTALHGALSGHPGLATLLGQSVHSSSAIQRIARGAADVLDRTGFSPVDQKHVHDTLIAATIGTLSIELARPAEGSETPATALDGPAPVDFATMLAGILDPLE